MYGDIPQRVWTGKDMSYRHPKVFSCLGYAHIAKDQRGKLDPKSRLCLFLGYDEDEFGYRLWDLIYKKVIRSQDIVIMEEKTIADWEMEKTRSTSKSIENRPPVIESGRVDDRPNRTKVDPTEIGYKPFGRVDVNTLLTRCRQTQHVKRSISEKLSQDDCGKRINVCQLRNTLKTVTQILITEK